MIYGIGTDLCDVGRIEKSIARPAFLQHVYTPAEQELIVAHTGKKQAETAAANFAAKEAFLKACGTGLSGFSMAEIAALRQPSGAPYLEFTGKAARFMAQNQLQAHLSLTHEAGLAGAFVVLERVINGLPQAVKHGKAFVWFAVHFKAPPRRMETLLIAANAANHL